MVSSDSDDEMMVIVKLKEIVNSVMMSENVSVMWQQSRKLKNNKE